MSRPRGWLGAVGGTALVAAIVAAAAVWLVKPAAPGPLDTSTLKLTAQPTRAEVTFTTAKPGFCLVVVGTQSGRYVRAIPESMPDGPHRSHVNQITDLKPGTRYVYRILFTASDGSMLQSPEESFRTPASAAGATPADNRPQGVNVALRANGGHILGVSSNYGGARNDQMWGADSAIDGDLTTAWSSNGDGDKAWISIGFKQSYTVTAIGFRTRTMGNSAEIKSIRVVTGDGKVLGPFALTGPEQTTYIRLASPVTTDRLRFEAVRTTGGNTGAAEIEVYAGK